MENKNKVAIYARVSSEEQREKGTIESQLEYAQQYCQLNNLQSVDIYRDDAVSGTVPFAKRPEGKRLLNDARQKKFSQVLVYRIDRIARNTKDLLDTFETLESLENSLRSMSEAFDTGTPTGKFIMTTLGSIAALERDTIIERTRLGQKRNAQAGRWNGGTSPYGYRVDGNGMLVIEAEEAKIVKRIYQMYGEEDRSTQQIADYLNAHNIATPFKRRDINKKTLGRWVHPDIIRVLASTTYKGVLLYGKRTKRPREPIEVSVPAIVNEELWQKGKEARKRNQLKAKRSAVRLYPLRRLIICGSCGRKYFGEGKVNSPYSYYRCSGKTTWREGKGVKCDALNLNAPELERIVWDDVRSYIKNPGEVVQMLEASLKERLFKEGPTEQDIEELESLEAEKAEARKRAISLYTKGLVPEEEVEDELTQLNQDVLSLQLQREDLMNKQEAATRRQNETINAKILLEKLQDKLEEADEETQYELIHTLVDQILVDMVQKDGQRIPQVTITYKFDKPDLIPEYNMHDKRSNTHAMRVTVWAGLRSTGLFTTTGNRIALTTSVRGICCMLRSRELNALVWDRRSGGFSLSGSF